MNSIRGQKNVIQSENTDSRFETELKGADTPLKWRVFKMISVLANN